MADANRCPTCGAERPANTPEGYCPRCSSGLAPNMDVPGPADVDATTAPAARASGRSPDPSPADTDATGAYIPEPAAGAAPSRPAGTDDRTIDVGEQARPADGDGASPDLSRGETVRYFGDYEILKELGRGGMGVVYKARQVTLNRPVALKMIKAGMLADDDDLRRFQNEAEAVALLDHPGIVSVYEIGEHDGQRYFSMKLIEGSNLAEQLASFRHNLRAAVALLIGAAEAVQHAHMRGILHRDLKPANVLIDTQGHPHITDFGLAKLMESDVELTASGAIMGTPAYMSPEQASGRRGSISLATDVYGLGAIFFALLTGRAPFGGDGVIETLDAVRARPPESPRKRNAAIPRDLELICLKCLEKNPADRYPTAQALADDLRRWAAGEPVSVRAAGAVERVAKWARRKPTLAAAYTLGLLAVLLGGLGGAAVWQWRAAARARDATSTARDNEATARVAAETAREGEAAARVAAETAREGEAAAREALARIEYGLSMEAALREWRENRLSAAQSILDKARPDLRGWEWRYVHRLCHSDLITLKGHSSNVNWASFSPDGSRIVTASTDRTAKVWDARTGADLLTLKGHTDRVFRASFSPDGSRIVTASTDKTAKVWDARTGADLLTLKGHDNDAYPLFSADGSRFITANTDGSVRIWDARTGADILTLKGRIAHFMTASFSRSGGPGSPAGRPGRIAHFMTASFSPDGSRVVTAGGDGTAKVWDARTGADILTLKGHTAGVIVQSVAFSPDGSRVVTASHDGTAKVWDAGTGADLLTLKGHKHWVLSASFSPDGSRVVTGCFDSTVKLWDARTGAEILTLRGHALPVMSASFSADGSRIVTASWDKTAKVWDAKTDFEVLTHHTASFPTALSSFSADGSRIVTPNGDGTAKVWDARTGAELLTLKPNAGGLQSASFSADGSRIVTAGSPGQPARVWDARTGDVILTVKEPGLISGSFSPDGSRVVSRSSDRTSKVWDAKTGDVILALKGHTAPVHCAAFSPDGLRVVTGGQDRTSRMWDARSGATLLTLEGHGSVVTSAAFSGDGSRVVTGCLDKTAKIWDARTGAVIRTLESRTPYDVRLHAYSEGSASFSPDGSRVVSATGDGSVKVWDTKTGAELFALMPSGGYFRWVSFSPDGSRILTTGDRTVMVWDAKPINREFLGRGFAAAAGTVE